MMTRHMLRLAIALGGVAALVVATLLLAGGPLRSEARAAGKDACTLGTLRGTYVYAAHGVLNDGQAVLPYAEAGTWTLDGAGHAQGVFSASLNGTTFASQQAFTATYRHETGCIYTAFA